MNSRHSKYALVAIVVSIMGFAGYELIIAPSSKSSTRMAVYISEPNEIVITPIWDNTHISCEGKPYDMWGSPGIYLYHNENGAAFTMTLQLGEAIPNFGVNGPDTPIVHKVL